MWTSPADQCLCVARKVRLARRGLLAQLVRLARKVRLARRGLLAQLVRLARRGLLAQLVPLLRSLRPFTLTRSKVRLPTWFKP